MEGVGARLGTVLRNGEWKVMAVGVRRSGARWPSPLAEAMAMIWGMHMARGLRYH